MLVQCVVSKDKRAKCRTNKTKKQVRMKYKQYKRTQTKKSPGGNGCLYLVSVEYCHVEVSATGRSLIQRTLTDCGVPLCVI